MSAISVEGVPVVGQTLTAKVTPDKATVTYQWQRANAADGTFENITGATNSTYKLTDEDAGKYIRVTATGTGKYKGTVESGAVGPVAVAGTWRATGNTGFNTVDGTAYVFQEFELLVNDERLSLDKDNVKSITVNGQELEPNTDETLWFNVLKETGEYKFVVVDKNNIPYEATLSWTAPEEKTATTKGEPAYNEDLDNYYQLYTVPINVTPADSKVFQIKPDGTISELTVLKDNDDHLNIWFRLYGKDGEQQEGEHIFLIKKGDTWSKAVISYGHAQATWKDTGKVGTHTIDGTAYVFQGFELLDAEEKQIALVASNIEKMTVLEPGAEEPKTLTVGDDTDPLMWFNVQKESGDYKYTVITKDGVTYVATLTWTAPTEVTATATGSEGEHEGNYYVEYELDGLDLSEFTKMYQIKPNGDISELTANTDKNLWFKTNGQLEGEHVFLVKKDETWYTATITYPDLKEGKVLNKNSGESYDTIQEAITAATEGDTIVVAAGMFDEPLTISKSLTILGVNADKDPRTEGLWTDESVVTGGIRITGGDVTLKGLTIQNKGILASNITGLTLINNKVKDISQAQAEAPAGSIIGLDVMTQATGPIVIQQNMFSQIGATNGTGTAIRIVRASDSITIADNIIENVTKNGINLYTNCLANENAKLTITGNEIINWDSDKDAAAIGGRAIRLEFNGAHATATAEITGNKLIPPTYNGKTPVDPEYVKLTYVDIEVDLRYNYWGSDSPDFNTILLVEGDKAYECTYVPYFTDADMTILGPSVINSTQGKGYDTISAAVAEAVDKDTIVVAAGTYDGTENTLEITKSITLKSVEAADAGSTIVADIVINANNVTIDGLTLVSGSKDAPVVKINGHTGITLSNNIIDGLGQNKKQGVWINRAEVTLNGNTIQNNLQNGIWVDAGKNLTITNNIVKNNLTGMNFNSSLVGETNIVITGNTFIENNKHGISIGGSAGLLDDKFTITGNTFENNAVSQFSDRRYSSSEDDTVTPGKEAIVNNNTFIPTEHYWEWDAIDVRWLLKPGTGSNEG